MCSAHNIWPARSFGTCACQRWQMQCLSKKLSSSLDVQFLGPKGLFYTFLEVTMDGPWSATPGEWNLLREIGRRLRHCQVLAVWQLPPRLEEGSTWLVALTVASYPTWRSSTQPGTSGPRVLRCFNDEVAWAWWPPGVSSLLAVGEMATATTVLRSASSYLLMCLNLRKGTGSHCQHFRSLATARRQFASMEEFGFAAG